MRRLALAGLLASLGALSLSASEQATPAPQRERVENGLRARVTIAGRPGGPILDRMRGAGVPGASVAVVRNYAVDWAKGYGVRNARTGEPVTTSTRFQVASITKPLTAVVTMSLVQEGRLDLDRDVNGYLKSWKVPENEFTRTEKVTLRRLLSHTAGLTVQGFDGYPADARVPTLLQVLDGLPPAKSQPIRVDQVPGSAFRYSGGGFTVLQQLVEDVTGRSLADLARERVFGPAGMTDSSIGLPPQGPGAVELSMAHVPEPVPGYRFAVGGSACCEWWTTPTDLARFAIAIQRALRGDTPSILSQATARTMLTPVAGTPVGLGFFLEQLGDTVYFTHDGGNPGFGSSFIASMEGGRGAVVVSNSNGGAAFNLEVLSSIGRAYDWPGSETFDFESAEHLVAAIREVKAKAPGDPMVAEAAVNRLGYDFMRAGMRTEALRVFEVNVELYPDSANAEDSLAESHEGAGHLAEALAHYRRALEKLDKFAARNSGYAANRAATQAKIAALAAKVGPRDAVPRAGR